MNIITYSVVFLVIVDDKIKIFFHDYKITSLLTHLINNAKAIFIAKVFLLYIFSFSLTRTFHK